MSSETFSPAELKELSRVAEIHVKGGSPVLCIRDDTRLEVLLDHIKGLMHAEKTDLQFIELDFRSESAEGLLQRLEASIGPMFDFMGATVNSNPEVRNVILKVRLILINPLLAPEGSDALLFITKYVKFKVAALTILFQNPVGLPKTVGNLVGEYSDFAHYLPPGRFL